MVTYTDLTWRSNAHTLLGAHTHKHTYIQTCRVPRPATLHWKLANISILHYWNKEFSHCWERGGYQQSGVNSPQVWPRCWGIDESTSPKKQNRVWVKKNTVNFTETFRRDVRYRSLCRRFCWCLRPRLSAEKGRLRTKLNEKHSWPQGAGPSNPTTRPSSPCCPISADTS